MTLAEMLARPMTAAFTMLRNAQVRYNVALTDAQAGTYTTSRMFQDAAGFWADAASLWTWPFPQQPETVLFTFTDDEANQGDPQRKTITVDPGVTAPSVSALGEVGGTGTIGASVTLDGDQLEIELAITAGMTVAAGLYQGLVYDEETPLAIVLAQLTAAP